MKTFKTVPSFTMPIDTTVSSGEAFVGGGHFIMEEIWKDINGYEGVYQISNLGRVKSLGYNMPKLRRNKKERIMKAPIDINGYKRVALKQKYKYSIHRLIAVNFIPNPENKPCINQINGIKTDNRIENLEWVTNSENSIHAYRVLKCNRMVKGVYQYDMAGTLINTFKSITEAEGVTGINNSMISRAASGKRSHTHNFKWSYIN